MLLGIRWADSGSSKAIKGNSLKLLCNAVLVKRGGNLSCPILSLEEGATFTSITYWVSHKSGSHQHSGLWVLLCGQVSLPLLSSTLPNLRLTPFNLIGPRHWE